MVDDHSRLAFAEVLPTLTARCAIGFLRRAVAWFAQRGVQIKALMSERLSLRRARLSPGLGRTRPRHLRIRPYRPRTNGKAERFIQTLLNEWAYERIYGSSRTPAPSLFSAYNSNDHTAPSPPPPPSEASRSSKRPIASPCSRIPQLTRATPSSPQLGERRRLRQAYDVHRAADLRGEAAQRVPLPQGDREHAVDAGLDVGIRAPHRFGNELVLGPGPAPARKGWRKTSIRALITSG